MTRYTPTYGLPYPEGQDAVAVHADVRDLALKVDAEVLNRYTISHVAEDLDGQPYFAPGTGTTRVLPDTDGTPFYIPS